MRAIILGEHVTEPQREIQRKYAIQILLVIAWGGLFTYCAAYLFEDIPFQSSSTPTIGEFFVDQPEDLPRRVIRVAAPVAPVTAAASADMSPTIEAAPLVVVARPPVPPVSLRPVPVIADYVGTWGPTADACGAPSRRNGYVPATITPERAKAGDTACSFRAAHRTGNAWAMAADCGDREHRWSSQVRLVVDGDRLSWTSDKGTSVYVRCNRRTG